MSSKIGSCLGELAVSTKRLYCSECRLKKKALIVAPVVKLKPPSGTTIYVCKSCWNRLDYSTYMGSFDDYFLKEKSDEI